MLKFWDVFEEMAGGLLLLGAVLLVFGQIVARTVFGFGVSGLYELATYCAVCSVFLTSSIAIKNNLHIRIDILANVVPPRVAFALEILVLLVMGLVSAALCWSGVVLVEESLMLNEWTLGTISLPVWALQLVLPVASGLMCLRTAQRVWRVARAGTRSFRHESAGLETI